MIDATTTIDEISGLGVRVTVNIDGERVATVLVTGRHQPAILKGSAQVNDDPSVGTVTPRRVGTSQSWPTSSADDAARRRWGDRHRGTRRVRDIWIAEGADATVPEVLEVAGSPLADRGIRRLDVRLHSRPGVASDWEQAGWAGGTVDGDFVASRALRFPWRMLPGETSAGLDDSIALDHLSPALRRAKRRLTHMDPAMVPELARTAAVEVAGLAGQRRWPTRPGHQAASDAPPGTSPLAVTRFRTIRDTLSLVPPALRPGGFLDIGAGNGRVLAEALRVGFGQVAGYELDTISAERAQQLVGSAATAEVGDALARPIDPHIGVVFLNNPFGADGVQRLGELVAETLVAFPRPLLVIYINPPTITPLEAAGLRVVDHRPTFTILATPPSMEQPRC